MKNLYRKLVLFATLMLGAFLSNAQKCDYAKNEIDPFLKIKKVETKETIIWNWQNRRLSLSFANYGDDKFVVANMSLTSDVLFAQGNNMIMLFEDGSTLEFELLAENGKPVSFGQKLNAAGVTYYAYKLMYKIDSTAALEGKKLAGVRVYTTGEYLEFKTGKTAMELGGAGKEKKMARIEALFTKQNLDCINI